MYYLGGAEYEAARLLLGLSERTWSDWAEEIRARVGAELIRAPHVPAGALLRPDVDEAGGATGVDKRRAQSENGCGAL